MEASNVSVVIVSLNRVEPLRRSLAALQGAELQVIVVDNGSRDGGASLSDEFPNVRFDRLPRNFGLTRALNIGIRAAEREYVLLLHDDVTIGAAAVVQLAEFLENRSDVAAVCPRLNGPQVRKLPTPSNPDPPLAIAGEGDEIVTECVSGAAIMVRATFLRNMGHIDERYGSYGSDIEICARIRSSNRKVVVLGAVRASHGTLPSPVPTADLTGDRAAGTAAFLGKHHGFRAGLLYRVKTTLKGLITLRFALVAASKIDGA